MGMGTQNQRNQANKRDYKHKRPRYSHWNLVELTYIPRIHCRWNYYSWFCNCNVAPVIQGKLVFNDEFKNPKKLVKSRFINLSKLSSPFNLVMVFIHGGGWSGGSGTSENHGAERFLDYGIVSLNRFVGNY